MNDKLKETMSVDEFRDKIEPPQEVLHLRKRVADLETKILSIREGEGELKELFNSLGNAVETAIPFPVQYKPKDLIVDSPVEAVLQCTDWHYGANQLADEIERFGEFSPDICRERVMDKLVSTYINWVELHRKAYQCDTLRIVGTGDLISGDIHDELKITNAFPTPVQSVKVAYLFSDMIQCLAPHFKEIVVDFITADNHGRMTKKPQSKEEGLNNFGYIVAHLAKERLKSHNNVKFNIHPVMQAVIHIQNTSYLTMHGHQIKGWAGIPFYGIERKVGKEAQKRLRALPELREAVRFDKILMGHYHTPSNMEDWMIGGSLSGTDAYDHKCGRYSLPTQTGWFVHPKHGEFDWTKFRL